MELILLYILSFVSKHFAVEVVKFYRHSNVILFGKLYFIIANFARFSRFWFLIKQFACHTAVRRLRVDWTSNGNITQRWTSYVNTSSGQLNKLDFLANTGCPGSNVPDFGRMFLTLKYTDITQNTYIRSWTVTEIIARGVWKYDSCYTLIDYQIHIKTARNM